MTACTVDSLAGLRRHIATLSETAQRAYDSYALSPAYYALTGRLGGSVIKRGDAFTVACRHPNTSGVQLIFPEISEEPTYSLGLHVAAETARRGLVAQFARLTDDHRMRLLHAFKSLASDDLELVEFEEDVLDWRFPVHVLDTSLVTTREGGRYKRLRQQLRKIERSRLTLIDYRYHQHSDAVEKLLKVWACQYAHFQYSMDITSPVVRLLQMDGEDIEGLRQQMLFLDGQACGLCVWEEPVFPGGPANQLAVVATHSVIGLSEWQMVLLCENLRGRGIASLNVGGSETQGLDRYKRKFRPLDSRPLYSAAVILKVSMRRTANSRPPTDHDVTESPQRLSRD